MAIRTSISVSSETREQLRNMQSEFERKVGFEPSVAQLVEYLVSEYVKRNNEDKVTNGQYVQTN
jgi:hypothetical protein